MWQPRRRLNESQPAPAGWDKSSDLPPHHIRARVLRPRIPKRTTQHDLENDHESRKPKNQQPKNQQKEVAKEIQSNQPSTPPPKAAANPHPRTPQPPLHHLPPSRTRSHRRGIRPLARPLEVLSGLQARRLPHCLLPRPRCRAFFSSAANVCTPLLDAFVESVDDVTFTGDTILRAMRAYSCIDVTHAGPKSPPRSNSPLSSDPGTTAAAPPAHRMSIPMSSTSNLNIQIVHRAATPPLALPCPELQGAHARKLLASREMNPMTTTRRKTTSRRNTTKKIRSQRRFRKPRLNLRPVAVRPLPIAPPHPRKLSRSCRQIHAIAVEPSPLPLAPPHPRKQGRETQFAARIRKAGRSPTTPLALSHLLKTQHITPRANQLPLHNPALCSIRIRRRAATVPLALPHPRKHSRCRSDILAPTGSALRSAIGSNPAPQPGLSHINLIYRPAIRNDGKP